MQKFADFQNHPELAICRTAQQFYSRGWTYNNVAGLAIKTDEKIYYLPSTSAVQYCNHLDVVSTHISALKMDFCAGVLPHLFEDAKVNAIGHIHLPKVWFSLKADSIALQIPIESEFNGTSLTLPIIDGSRSNDALQLDIMMAHRNTQNQSTVFIRDHGLVVWGESWMIVVKKLETIGSLLEAICRTSN